MADFNGKNIKFLQGTYDRLNALTSSEVGAFYITNDTHEMFLGVEANKAPVALNRWVDVKENVAAIKAVTDYKNHPGKIYYAKAENILCTYNGTDWVQINPDTDTDTSLSKVEITKGETVENEGKKSVKYTLTFTQKNIAGDDLPNPLTADLEITDELVTSLVVDVKVGLQATVTGGVATVKTVGAGSDATKNITITGEDGVSITEKDGQIVIDGTTYTLGSENAKIVLNDTNNGATKVEFVGDNWIATSGDSNGKINITHGTPHVDGAADVATISGDAITINADTRKFSALTAIKADENGHVTNAEITEFTIPNTVYELEGEYAKVEGADYSTVIKIIDGDNNEDKVDIKTAHVITVDGQKKVIANGGDFGAFYSAAEIDRQFRVLDALTYKGTVADSDDIPTSNVALGDTYKVSAKFDNYEVGDLLIANGTEGSDGYISGTITWDHIATGTDADTTYTFSGADNKIILKNNVSGGEQAVSVAGDDYITATVTNNAIGIAHNTITRTNTTGEEIKPAHAASFDVVTAVSSNAAGHITGVETTTVTLPGEDQIVVNADNRKFIVKNASGEDKGSIAIEAGDKLDAVGVIADGKNLTVTVSHEEIETTTNADTSKNVTVALDGTSSFEVVDSLIDDGYGHITGVKTKTVNVAKETTYTLTDAAIANNIVTQDLKDNNNDVKGSIKLASETLTYTVKNGATNIDLVWGNF